jgi:hypothetical protein
MFGGNESQIKAHLEAVEVRTKDNEGGGGGGGGGATSHSYCSSKRGD